MILITVSHPDRCLVGLLQLPISSRYTTLITISHPDQCTVSLLQFSISSRHMTLILVDHPCCCTVGLLQFPISSRHLTLITADHPSRGTVSVFLQLRISRHTLALQLWPQPMPVRIPATAGMYTVQSCMVWTDPGLAMMAPQVLMMSHSWPIQQRTMLGPKGNLKRA